MSATDERAQRAQLLQRVGIAFGAMVALLLALPFLDRGAPPTVESTPLPAPLATERIVAKPVAAVVPPASTPVPSAATEGGTPEAVNALAAAASAAATAASAATQSQAGTAVSPAAAVSAPAAPPPVDTAQCPTPQPVRAECPAPAAPERRRPRAMPPGKGYTIQLGGFGDPDHADRLQSSMVDKGLPAHVESRVVLGPFKNKAEAEKAQKALSLKGFGRGTVAPPGR